MEACQWWRERREGAGTAVATEHRGMAPGTDRGVPSREVEVADRDPVLSDPARAFELRDGLRTNARRRLGKNHQPRG